MLIKTEVGATEQRCGLLAYRLHGDTTDKAGRPYIDHPRRVASLVQSSGGTWVQVCAAWLHDSLEDTEATSWYLLQEGVPSSVVDLVVALTHLKGDTNQAYWDQVRETPGAKLIKLCDIHDNLDPSRLCYLDEATQDRLRKKYSEALRQLTL